MPIYNKEDIVGYISSRGTEFYHRDCFDKDDPDLVNFDPLVEGEVDEDKIYKCEKCGKRLNR